VVPISVIVETKTRSSLLIRLGTLAAVLVLLTSWACMPARQDPSALSRGNFPDRGVSPLSETELPKVKRKARSSLPAEASLIAKITAGTSPQQAASLRLTEDGKRLLESGHYAKALTHLEKTLAIDSSNPYVYYYLAKAHFNLVHYRQSVDFLDVAESLLDSQPYWMAEVLSLKGENFQAMGLLKEANFSYAEALRFNPSSRNASVGLSRVQRALEVPSIR